MRATLCCACAEGGPNVWGHANLVEEAGAEGKAAVEAGREGILIRFVPVDIDSQLCVRSIPLYNCDWNQI